MVIDEYRYSIKDEKIMQSHWDERLKVLKPNVFLTITLFDWIADPEKVINKRSIDFDGLHKEVLNRIDRCLYGSNHHKMAEEHKFGCFYRLETKTKRNDLTCPHIHALMQLNDEELAKLQKGWPGLQASLEKLLDRRDFRNDIRLVLHDGDSKDYVTKYPLTDIENTFVRNC